MPSELEVGDFVIERNRDTGFARVVELDSDASTALIEYVDLPDRLTERRTVQIDDLDPQALPRETRAWVRTSEFGWLPGRVDTQVENHIALKFPGDKDPIGVPQDQVVVRWDRELTACDQAIALGFTDSPGYYRARMPLVKNLIGQRAACRGFTAAMSAAVRPFQHQLNVLARVLGDPVPRFVLADEVGLGKTIEAGLIIRQFLLDDPNSSVVVSVPATLQSQWEQELSTKLLLDKYLSDQRLRVLDHDDLSLVPLEPPNLLVVDEAHRLTKYGLDSDDFQIACHATAQTESLLLLTATPFRGNAPTFLGLLHLIDPAGNDLEDLEGFTDRLLLREEQASAIESLNSDLPAVYLDPILDEFLMTFPRDEVLSGLIARVREHADSDDSQFVQAKNEVAGHLRETYRISRRVIRNRRSEVVAAGFPVSGRSFEKIQIQEPSRGDIDTFIEQWRECLLAMEEANNLTPLFVEGLERALSGPDALLSFVDRRLDGEETTSLEEQAVGELERHLLTDIRARLRLHGESEKLKSTIEECVSLAMAQSGKTVLFTSFPDIAEQLVEEFGQRLAAHRYASHLEYEGRSNHDAAIDSFTNYPDCRLLVCDRSAEEGRNLQSADIAIHWDLPLSPNRLEQRIGRFDRFSERLNQHTQSRIYEEPDSELTAAHLTLMERGVGLFTESVATLQIPLADLESKVETNLLAQGLDALQPDLDQLREDLDEERRKIALLEQLEATAIDTDFSLGDFDAFQNFDENWGDSEKAFDLLTGEESGINLRKFPNQEAAIFKYSLHPQAWKLPLVPLRQLLTMAPEIPGMRSFNRVLARSQKGVKVMGLGDPFVDHVENYLRLDERGHARVAYRYVKGLPAPRLVACFDFVVEFEDRSLPESRRRRLRRRGDVFFPPIHQAVWTEGQSAPAPDERLITMLEGNYSAGMTRQYPEHPVRGQRWQTVISVFPDWEQRILQYAEHARELLAEDSAISERLERARDRANDDAKRRLQILRLQIDRADDTVVREMLEATREGEQELLDAIKHGLKEPRIQMIAAGAYVLGSEKIDVVE